MAAVRSPMLSPAVSTATGSFLPVTPMELISPATRRTVSVMNPSVASSTATSSMMMLRTEKDDETERRERRRSRLLEIQRRNLSSPATPTDRRRSMPLTGLSNAQLTDHYTSCIKLSAENKINAKNAFGLHLIDYLSELMKKKDMNNFQVASSTLDASAKIYAGRVDAIHTETYKVLTGLGRGGERQDSDGSGGGDGPDEDHDTDGKDGGKNKRKRARRDQTIEANLKNINVNKFDLEFEVDPLFQKTSATFDEGGSGGLLLNHLYCIDDSSAIILDSNTVVTGAQDRPTNDNEGSGKVDLMELRGLYSRVNLETLQICPEFSEFSFTNWNSEEEAGFNMSRTAKECERRFDLDAEVEPFSVLMPNPGYDEDDDNGGDLPVDDFTGKEDDPSDTKANTSGSSNYTVGDGKEAQLMETVMSDMKQGTIGSLIQVLAAEPTEYSYFSTNILRSWAGPEHWKLKAKTNEDTVSEKNDDEVVKKKRKKKEPLKIEFNEDEDTQDNLFQDTRAATTLTKKTLVKYSQSKTLPEDLHYDTDNLFRLFTKPKVMVRRQENPEDLEDGIDNYDYNNDNDKENFVPYVEGDDNDDDDDGDPMGGTMEFNLSAGDGFSQTQDMPSSQEDGMNTTVFTGDNLVAQPDKIAKLHIGYAKTAKKVDVKRLKASMWNLLVKPEPKKKKPKLDLKEGESENVDEMEVEEESEGPSKPNAVAGEHTFQCLMADLPNCLSKNMTKNLSVPIAFVCLLHLANEKALKIWSVESMDDLHITQG